MEKTGHKLPQFCKTILLVLVGNVECGILRCRLYTVLYLRTCQEREKYAIKRNIKLDSFYVLKPDGKLLFGTKWAYADQIDPVLRGEAHTCPVCGSSIGGLAWLPPHRIKLSSAKPEKWGDFVWGAGFRLMVSGRFKALYEAEGLTGIDYFHPPAEIVRGGTRKTGDLPPSLPDYHLVEIKWNGANLDDTASEIARTRVECAFCRTGGFTSLERVILEPDSWDGSEPAT